MKNIVILENDQERYEGIPEEIKRFQRKNDLHTYTIWDWFSCSIRQDRQAAIRRLKTLSKDSVFLTYTQFIEHGYDALDGWIFFMNKLADEKIKLSIYVIYGYEEDNLFTKLLESLGSVYPTEREIKKKEIRKALESHEIFTHGLRPKTLEDFKQITPDSIFDMFFEKGEVVRVKSTSQTLKVAHAIYFRGGGSSIELIVDQESHDNHVNNKAMYNKDAYKEFELLNLEKVK